MERMMVLEKWRSDGHIPVIQSKFGRYVIKLLCKCSFLTQRGELQVEVGPSSFLKIKMLGKGDVGRVYLVREKKTDKLFAMKGGFVI
jgi:hypothetical protein